MPAPAYWRSADHQGSPADLQFLLEASNHLLGYRVHLAFKQFLDVAVGNFERWHAHGLVRNLRQPAAVQTVAFDFGAIDLERLTRALGVYLYIYAGHKGANHRLMHPFPGRQVLYLRGYEFAVSAGFGEGMAAEASSVETLRFNLSAEKLVGPDLCVFKVLSPEETHWGTRALDAAFRAADIDTVAQRTKLTFRSLFLNALHWQHGVRALLDRVDHVLVYVCSITPSALWELEQLDTDAHRGRVTVVFDAEAIFSKGAILSYQKTMLEQGGEFIWPRHAAPPTFTAEELRARLAAKFHVVTLDDFVTDPGRHRERIGSTASPLPPGQRETSIDFRFHPAIPDEALAELRDHAAWLKARIENAIAQQDIDSPLLFLNDVLLRIHSTLLLGEHDETGRALAAYSGMLGAVLATYSRTPELKIWQSPLAHEHNVHLLHEHIQVARDWGVSLMSCGPSDRFESRYERALAEFLEREAGATAAVDQLLHRWPIDPA